MDFELTEEQQLLKHSVERCSPTIMAFDARKRYAQEPRRLEPRSVEAICRARPARPAVRRRARRLRRRPGRDHDRDGGRSAARWRSSPISRPSCSAAGCLRHGGSKALRAELLPKIAGGRAACSPSPMPSGRRATILPTSRRRARRDGAGYVLDGAKSLVLHGDSGGKVHRLGARLPAASATATASALFLVDANARRRVDARLSDASTACAPPR